MPGMPALSFSSVCMCITPACGRFKPLFVVVIIICCCWFCCCCCICCCCCCCCLCCCCCFCCCCLCYCCLCCCCCFCYWCCFSHDIVTLVLVSLEKIISEEELREHEKVMSNVLGVGGAVVAVCAEIRKRTDWLKVLLNLNYPTDTAPENEKQKREPHVKVWTLDGTR